MYSSVDMLMDMKVYMEGMVMAQENHEKSEVLDLRHDSVVQNLRKRKTRVIFFCVFSSETLQLA